MKSKLLTTAIVMAFASMGAFAHHPAADIVDPEIYAMIDENVSDTPHADLVFDDMGRDVSGAGDSMESRDNMDAAMENRDTMGTENMARSESGEVSAPARGPWEQVRNNDDDQDGDDIDTLDLLQNVLTTLGD